MLKARIDFVKYLGFGEYRPVLRRNLRKRSFMQFCFRVVLYTILYNRFFVYIFPILGLAKFTIWNSLTNKAYDCL